MNRRVFFSTPLALIGLGARPLPVAKVGDAVRHHAPNAIVMGEIRIETRRAVESREFATALLKALEECPPSA